MLEGTGNVSGERRGGKELKSEGRDEVVGAVVKVV